MAMDCIPDAAVIVYYQAKTQEDIYILFGNINNNNNK